MVTRVNGGVFDNQALTGSLCHYRILGADFSGAISDGTYSIPNGAGPNIDLLLGEGEPVPYSAAEEVMRIVMQLATVVITNPTDEGMFFATENTDNGWLDTEDLQQCIRDLGTNVGVDGLDLSGVTVEKVPYILGVEGETLAGLDITNINGQDMVTLVDDSRGGKKLTVTEQEITFSENRVNNLDWMSVGDAGHANTGFIFDFDGTITSVTAICPLANGNEKEFRMDIEGVEVSLGALGPADNSKFSSTILNTDFNQGDKIRVRAYDGTGGNIRDVVIKITMKWRG